MKGFEEFAERIHAALGDDPSTRRAADDFALSVASLGVVVECWRSEGNGALPAAIEFAARDPLCAIAYQVWESLRTDSTASVLTQLDLTGAVISTAKLFSAVGDDSSPGLFGFFEHLLAQFDAPRRKELGVYFTPPAAVDYIVAAADRVLREEFGCVEGLAAGEFSCGAPLRILDPALGSGAFLCSALRRIQRTFAERASEGRSNDPPARRRQQWSVYVSDQLLPRLCGVEIMPAPLVLANFLLAMELLASGFQPRPGDRLPLVLGDALAMDRQMGAAPFTVVIGNPPYRGISSNTHAWISRLLRGRSPSGGRAASYLHVDGAPLGERKIWLHDDYVKFFRCAQWQIEQSGAGVVALLTNHGFLDNSTFRGMRQALLETFTGIEVVDLHGNAKAGAAVDDESLFPTAQGMAITLAWKRRDGAPTGQVRHGDLVGARDEKIRRLSSERGQSIAVTSVRPRAPHYFFHAASDTEHLEYAAGFRLPDIMPVNSTAVVTARDWFVVDIDRRHLEERLAEFADLSISDDEIRRRYFQRTRSAKYAAGDTRGWKLAAARRRLANEPNWRRCIRRCWYRPFDRRWIFWAPWMIDWPREQVMRHLQPGNAALVCRRQSVRGRPCNFFWIADDIVLDGYIRSDNRGSESVFPLYLRGAEYPLFRDLGDEPGESPLVAVNFADDFLAACKIQWKAELAPSGNDAPDRERTFAPTDLLHYIYALFHSPTYRRRYADDLAVDFPRVLLPNCHALFCNLATFGRRLASWHLLAAPPDQRLPCPSDPPAELHGSQPARVDAGFPRFKGDRVHLSPDHSIGPVGEDAWQFRIGAHQVLQKWLKDRRQATLGAEDVSTYLRIVAAVRETRDIMRQIDVAITDAGGWPRAFIPVGRDEGK